MARFLFVYAGMTVLAALLARWAGCPSLFRLPAERATLIASLVAAVVVAAVVVLGGRALERVDWYRRMAAFLKRMLTSPELLGPRIDGQKAFVVAVYSSVGEEALFRGFLQPWLIQLLQGPLGTESVLPVVGGVVGASLVFGALHFPLVRELLPWTVFAVVAGIAFGALAAWSGSLAAPVVAHLGINWLNLKRLSEIRLEGDPGVLP